MASYPQKSSMNKYSSRHPPSCHLYSTTRSKPIGVRFLYGYQEATTMSDASWRSSVGDIPIRLMIVRKIQEAFQEIHLLCEPELLDETLGSLVPRLEFELYQTATSLEEYGDPRTVRERLERLAPHQGHVRPLEALWLQGLLNNEATIGRSSSQAEPVATAMATDFAAQPSSTPIASSSAAPSRVISQHQHHHQRQMTRPAADAAAGSCDSFTRSLRQVRQYLRQYDTFSDSIVVVTPRSAAILLPDDVAAYEETPAQLTAVPDLQCHERLEDR